MNTLYPSERVTYDDAQTTLTGILIEGPYPVHVCGSDEPVQAAVILLDADCRDYRGEKAVVDARHLSLEEVH